MIRIRERRPEDLPVLCDVLSAQAEESGYPIRWPWSAPVEEFIVRTNEERAWVAVLDVDGERVASAAGRTGELDRPVGHVAVERVVEIGDGIAEGWIAATGRPASELACISVFFVDQEQRHAGIGSALLDTAVAWIRDQGRTPVLDVVEFHRPIVDLYVRRGWREVGLARPDWLPEAGLVLLVLDD